MVGLGRRLHEGALPLLGKRRALGRCHLAQGGRLVGLVADKHDGNVGDVGAADRVDLGPDRTQLVQRLPADDRVDQNERVTLADRQALHCRELMATGRVGYLQRAYLHNSAFRQTIIAPEKSYGTKYNILPIIERVYSPKSDNKRLEPIIIIYNKTALKAKYCPYRSCSITHVKTHTQNT